VTEIKHEHYTVVGYEFATMEESKAAYDQISAFITDLFKRDEKEMSCRRLSINGRITVVVFIVGEVTEEIKDKIQKACEKGEAVLLDPKVGLTILYQRECKVSPEVQITAFKMA
jgi:hypothetical protein